MFCFPPPLFSTKDCAFVFILEVPKLPEDLKIQRYCDAMCCPVMDGIYVEIIASELLGEEYLFLKGTLEKWKEGFWSYKDKSLNPAPVIYWLCPYYQASYLTFEV